MISTENRFFPEFEMERICFDKYFFVVYDEKYAMQDHLFDKKVAQEYFNYITKSRVKGKGKFVDVLRVENEISFYELHLSKARHLFVYINIIKYIQKEKEIKPDPASVISKDNFLPVKCDVNFVDFVEAKLYIEQNYITEYRKLLKKLWNYDAGDVKIKPVQLEICLELFPGSVSDISARFQMNEVAFKRYNTQSGTIYLNESLGSQDIRLPDGLIMKIDDDHEFLRDSQYVSKLPGGYSTDWVQIKFYQKSFGLIRIEFSIVNDTIKKLHTEDDFINFLHSTMNDNLAWHEYIKRFDVSVESIVKAVAKAVHISEELCYILKDVEIWETNFQSRHIKAKLMKRGLIEPLQDDIGTKKRGKYIVSPWFREIFKGFKETKRELFLELPKRR